MNNTTDDQHGTVTRIVVYWDSQDPNNEGWAVRWDRIGDKYESAPIDYVAHDDLDGAIDQACWDLGVPINHDDFGRDEQKWGGYGTWSADDVDCF